MAEENLLPTGYLYQASLPTQLPRGRYSYPYPYAVQQKYDAQTALHQGTLLPWLDDHWHTSRERQRG